MLLALIASALVVFGSPYVGQIRGALESAFPQYYRLIIGGTVGVAVVAAVVLGVTAIRRRDVVPAAEHRHRLAARRYWLIAAAVVVATVYARIVSSGNADLDVVERFHFVEYGLITFLFYRVWRREPDVSAVVVPGCAALMVGIADEGLQWFVPGRVGELHDVWLDGAAIVCGLLFSAAVYPPVSFRMPRETRSRRAAGASLVALVIVMAAFVDRVHLGYEIRDNASGVFWSQDDASGLLRAAADRQARPPVLPGRGFSREDHYVSEGLWHVQLRNMAAGSGDARTAWGENLILEKYFRPVLDLGFRWPREQYDSTAATARNASPAMYVSHAAPYSIYVIDRRAFWSLAALLAGVIVWVFR